ncbi:MAG TPA: hypothetical protein VN950_26590 [Terriglobales bacterium]|nr:hypothetical protein [Terriglobales bacterium]
MPSTRAAYRNSCVSASGKIGDRESRSLAIKLASVLTRKAGLVSTWPNIQTVRLAIESESGYSRVSLTEAANVILAAALERSHLPQYACPSQWERFEAYRENNVNRFWFEDARWRSKLAYSEFLLRLREGGQEAG